MPLQSGSSQAVISHNIKELHTGNTFAKTEKKFGKAKADKQAIAIAESNARKSGNEHLHHNDILKTSHDKKNYATK